MKIYLLVTKGKDGKPLVKSFMKSEDAEAYLQKMIADAWAEHVQAAKADNKIVEHYPAKPSQVMHKILEVDLSDIIQDE